MHPKGKQLLKNKQYLRWFWWFIWDDDSVLSWIAAAIVAFLLIKFLIYPALGLALGTTHPIVAVVSGSMEHKVADVNGNLELCGTDFDEKQKVDYDFYWETCGPWYESHVNITKEQFKEFPFKKGFNTGDIMVLYGKKPEKIETGDVVVYFSPLRSDPIIHRVVDINEEDSQYIYQTKGDHNPGSNPDEVTIQAERLTGYQKYGKGSVAVFRIPYLGWIKIAFVELINLFS